MDIKESYIWLDEIKEKLKDELIDKEIECIDLCKLMIKEKITQYSDEKFN